jgi:hypothetical protein
VRLPRRTGRRLRPRWPSYGPRRLAKTPLDGRSSGLALREKKKSDLDTEREPEKRQVYEHELAQYEAHQRVYLDEAGINNTEDYAYG